MVKDFIKFLKEFDVITLAVGFIMGTAATALVSSLVKDILMPIAEPFITSESWRDASVNFGPINITYGAFLAELVNFLILALIIFIVVKKILKMEKEEKSNLT